MGEWERDSMRLPWWLPHLLVPDSYVRDFSSLSLEYWQARAIRLILLDVDDTLVAKYETRVQPSQALVAWLDNLQAAGITVVLFSNGGVARVAAWAAALGLEGFALVGKPAPWAFLRMLKKFSVTPSQVAMVGDQLFTDIWGANSLGLHSVLLEARSAGAWHTRQLRKLEGYCKLHIAINPPT